MMTRKQLQKLANEAVRMARTALADEQGQLHPQEMAGVGQLAAAIFTNARKYNDDVVQEIEKA